MEYIIKDEWVTLPGDTRFKIRQAFAIPLNESSVVVDDRVISDGVTQDSLRQCLNVTKMLAYLGIEKPEEATAADLLKLIADKVNGRDPLKRQLPEGPLVDLPPAEEIIVPAPAKPKRKKKDA